SGVAVRPNNSFKPKLLRYTKCMAGRACHAFGSTTQFGLTQALGGTGTAPHMMSQKKIGLVAIATPAWFLTVYLVMSAMRPDYVHTDQAISELGSLDAPNLWAWNVLGYILPGLAVALLGIGLRREFVGRGL